jgi:hypothetical protein
MRRMKKGRLPVSKTSSDLFLRQLRGELRIPRWKIVVLPHCCCHCSQSSRRCQWRSSNSATLDCKLRTISGLRAHQPPVWHGQNLQIYSLQSLGTAERNVAKCCGPQLLFQAQHVDYNENAILIFTRRVLRRIDQRKYEQHQFCV